MLDQMKEKALTALSVKNISPPFAIAAWHGFGMHSTLSMILGLSKRFETLTNPNTESFLT